MNNSKNYIINELKKIHNTFNDIQIKYEYRSYLNTHIIEILPLHFFENNTDFILKEIEIQNNFEKLYGHKEEILFISSNSLNDIRNIDFSLGYNN